MKVFLGGTYNGTTWRDELIVKLKELDMDYFNPVVEDWTPACIEGENRQKEDACGTHLYYITSAMTGVYSIAEAVDSAHSEKDCIFVVDPAGFEEGQLKSLEAVGKLIGEIGGSYMMADPSFKNILDLLEYLKEADEL